MTVGGIHFSVASGLILLATLIPAGALAFNPKVLNSMPLLGQEEAGKDGKLSAQASAEYEKEGLGRVTA